MAFKLDESGSYQWPVTVEIPSDGGEYIKQSFEVKFKRITQTRIREIGNEIEANKLTDVDLEDKISEEIIQKRNLESLNIEYKIFTSQFELGRAK